MPELDKSDNKRVGEPRAGQLWRHYQGDLYEVAGIGRHTETAEYLVIYKRANSHKDVHFFVRPLAMFMEKLQVYNLDSPEHTKEEVYRFTFVRNKKMKKFTELRNES